MKQGLQVWYPAFIALGSNQGHPVKQLRVAIEKITALDKVKLIAESEFYQSEPYGPVEQQEFVNAAIGVITQLSPDELMRALLEIEKEMGRKRTERWGPRIIDLDLLVYSDRQSDSQFLQLPHPEIAKRNFVLTPLNDIAPELLISDLGRVSRLLADCAGGQIKKCKYETKHWLR